MAAQWEQAAERAVEVELRRHPLWRILLGVAGWVLVAVYFAFAAAFLSLRYWVLPHVGAYTGEIESALSAAIGEKVTVGSLRAGWDGLRPELDMTQLEVHDRDGRLAFSLPAVEAVVAWSSLAFGSIRFQSLAFDGPDLAVRRDAQGRLYVAGMQLKESQGGPDFSNWLLAQNEVSIRNARLSWTDEQRGAPPLELAGVNLLMRNSGRQHRFAFRAQTARELASALDVRGDMRGDSLARIDQWSGELYSELDYTDLAAWQRWFDYPFELRSGAGGVRVWIGVAGGRPIAFTADVALSRVAARLAPDLPLLELADLRGRMGARNSAQATEIFGKGVTLRDGQSLVMNPADFSLRVEPGLQLPLAPAAGAAPSDAAPRHGRLTASSLELRPLVQLAEYLPFPEGVRKRLSDADPRGTIADLALDWAGDPAHPAALALQARFTGLAMRANGGVPGFAGLSGRVDADQGRGSLMLTQMNALHLPGIFSQDTLQFDQLKGELDWAVRDEQVDVRAGEVNFANADLAGSLSGTYVYKPGTPGVADITGALTRVNGPAVPHYIPLLPAVVQDYLKQAIQGGVSSSVRLRLKGDLAHFPFDNAGNGLFQIAAHITDASFNYAPAWPGATAIAGDLVFEGRSMRILAQRAAIMGMRASVRAVIPDLFASSHVLGVDVQADGGTQEFLRFIDASPLAQILDHATEPFKAAGNGRLQLKLDIPLGDIHALHVAGSYLMQNNQLTLADELPPLNQLSGRLNFSEEGINARGVAGQFLGGPVSVSLQTQGDGAVAVTAQGTASAAALRGLSDSPLAARVSGAAPWRGSALVKKHLLDFSVDSTLQGVVIDLPAPLGKSAAEVMPLHLERGSGADSDLQRRLGAARYVAHGDSIAVSLGKALNVALLRREEGDDMLIERGNIALNSEASLPDHPGVALSGNLPYLDADRWDALLGGEGKGAIKGAGGQAAAGKSRSNQAAGPAGASSLTSIDLKAGILDYGGKRFNDVTARLAAGAGGWSGSIASREMTGDVTWRTEGRHVLQARFKQFTIPADRPAAAGAQAQQPPQPAHDLPGLDITADDFVLRERHFGRLELAASNETRDWRIDKLVLASPDATLNADGVWQSWAARPSISLNVKLDVSDAGKFMDRMGFPRTMQRGAARLEGRIGWTGRPQEVDYGTLTGNLTLSAQKGQFLKADPGVAKLLGIFSLQSLATLDLRSLFSEGFAYDSIDATAAISKGVLATDDFHMKGAAAQVSMKGSVDLAKETQNLHLRVVPALGGGAATALLFANPALGVLSAVVNNLLKDPLGQIFALEYDVTGNWSDPNVQRTGAHVEPRPESGPTASQP
jgi:uncharacterized protein (TIGR02099 family)